MKAKSLDQSTNEKISLNNPIDDFVIACHKGVILSVFARSNHFLLQGTCEMLINISNRQNIRKTKQISLDGQVYMLLALAVIFIYGLSKFTFEKKY